VLQRFEIGKAPPVELIADKFMLTKLATEIGAAKSIVSMNFPRASAVEGHR
jgi:hypothetical protein